MSLKQMQALERGMTPEYEKWTEWVCKCGNSYKHRCSSGPQRQWVGLTPEERDEINAQVYGAVPHHVAFHHAIEAKLKQKNGYAEEKNT